MNPAHAPHSVVPIHPHPDQLQVVTVIFNPRRFLSRYRLYRTFAKQMADSGVNLMTVEIAFGDRDFEVTSAGNPWNLQLRTNVELWHKERALNLGIQKILQLVPGAKYVAWIDADITFIRSDWAQETIHMLQHHPVVQMFGGAINLKPDEEILWRARGMGAGIQQYGKPVWNCPDKVLYGTKDHPGLAWAFRRATLDAMGGLLDFCIAGSADLHMIGAWMGTPMLGHPETLSREYKQALNNYAELAHIAVRKNVGYVKGEVVHHWHGKTSDRGYDKRWEIMERHQFNPYLDLKADAQGLLAFTGRNPELANAIRSSLSKRNEDSVDV
jgi:hypothetical protein